MAFVALLSFLAQAAAVPGSQIAYVPERVFDTRRNAFGDFEVMLADLASADVIVVGEHHDDPNTHRLQHAILDGFRRRHLAVTVSLEMFERDVQPTLDSYLAGTITEAQFLEAARPWPRYATDYRPLVELAKDQGWRVVAANVPRRYAADVAKSGKSALDRLSGLDRAMAAQDIACPQDTYFERFAKVMSDHRSSGKPGDTSATSERTKPPDPATTERYYWSQCVKDETMAESIARAFDPSHGEQGPIVHFNGSFHSDFGGGVTERIRRRLEGRRIAVVTILPVTNIDTLAPSREDLKRADFLVYTVK